MRNFYWFLFVGLFLLLGTPVFGQHGVDSLGLTGTMGDTVVANRLFAEMKGLINEGKWTAAATIGETAIFVYTKVVGEKSKQVAEVWHQMGFIGYSVGNYSMASASWEKALSIRLNVLGDKHLDVAKNYNNLGSIYYYTFEYEKAIKCHEKALNIWLNVLGADHPNVAASYNNLGSEYYLKGEYDNAIKYLYKSLTIRLKALGAEDPDVAASYINLGGMYYANGENEKSIEYSKKALKILLKAFGEERLDIAKAYNNLAAAYASKGEYSKAIEQHQKALAIEMKILGVTHQDVATSYVNLGSVYSSKGDYDKAIECQQKALEILLKTSGSDLPIVAKIYSNLGSTYYSKAENEKSIEYYKKSLEIFIKTWGIEHPDVASAFNHIGDSYRLIEEYNNAIQYYKNALNSCKYKNYNFEDVNSMQQLLTALHTLSYIAQKQYFKTQNPIFLDESLNHAQQTLAAIDYQLTIFTEESTKSYWQNKNYSIYELAIYIALLKAQVENNAPLRQTTFTYAEKSKAALLQAQLKATDAINFAGIADSLLQKEHDLRIDITWREKQRQALLDKGIAETDTNALRISSIIFDLKRDYEALKQRFERENPEYYRLKYALNTVSLRYVQDTLLQPKNQALLEYFVGDSSIYLFVVRPDTLIVREMPRDFPLEDWIEQFRQGLYGYYTADKAKQTNALYEQSLNRYLEYAPKLYQKLVAPVQELLPEQGSVIIVPDGPLGYIPFDALLTAAPENPNDFKQYPYLLNRYQFSYTYSATLLQEMRDKKHHHEPSKSFVAFAPFYNGDTTLLAGMYTYDELMRKDMQPLAYSGPEVAAASKLMHGEIVSGQAATEARFTSIAGNYRILHLATHGRADNRVGDYAFLAFTEIKDSLENELLYVKDLYNLELNADLVVLSACETGIGKLQRGEGIISLARAFAYAGAKSMVTTLWEVNDKSTSELMRYFYRALQNGENKDQALRSARREYFAKTNGRGGHPFFWAAFIPIGDMRPVKK